MSIGKIYIVLIAVAGVLLLAYYGISFVNIIICISMIFIFVISMIEQNQELAMREKEEADLRISLMLSQIALEQLVKASCGIKAVDEWKILSPTSVLWCVFIESVVEYFQRILFIYVLIILYWCLSVYERGVLMTTVSTKNGKVIKVISREEEKKTLSVSDSEMDKRAVEAVKAAINKAKICRKPIAGYDKEKKAAYIEYANGDRKYAE